MTAIAYRDGIMAADTLVSASEGAWFVRGTTRKIARSPTGTLGAASGHCGMCERFLRWITSGQVDEWLSESHDSSPPPDLKCDRGGFGAIIVQPTADQGGERVICIDYQGNPIHNIKAPFYVEGSAESILIGALAHGASAEEAVRIAIQYDTGCGGDVQVESLYPRQSLPSLKRFAAMNSDVVGF